MDQNAEPGRPTATAPVKIETHAYGRGGRIARTEWQITVRFPDGSTATKTTRTRRELVEWCAALGVQIDVPES